jgi:kynurenine formamidase
MKRYIDLSGLVENGLWSYRELPGLQAIIPLASIDTIATVKENSFFSSKISLSTITGTYMESGAHIIEGAKTLDEYPVADFIRPAKIIRLPRQKEKAFIDDTTLAAGAPNIDWGDAVIVDSGWGSRWNRPGYVRQCPTFSRKAVEWLLARGIAILGTDVPCIESSWSEDAVGEKGGLLGMMFRKDVLLAAPLVNLDEVKGQSGMLYCLPMRVKGTSGAPARIVFEEDA